VENIALNYILIVLFGLVIILWVTSKREKKSEQEMNENNFVIRKTKNIFWVGVFVIILIFVYIGFAVNSNQAVGRWEFIFFFICIIFGLYQILKYLNWKIIIQGNQIIYLPFFGKKGNFKIDDITYVMQKKKFMERKKNIIIYSDEEALFFLDTHDIGFKVLETRLKKEEQIKWV
jgi:hypothetical protein